MRIVGADSFTGRATSISSIPVSVLNHQDLCVVKIEAGDPDYIPAVYFYEYITNSGQAENFPYIINPIDNIDGVDSGSRWRLKDIFVNSLHTNSLYTNMILSEIPGIPINIGDTFTVSASGVHINNGQVFINSSLTEPPLVVNSNVMVQNLNAEFINGEGLSSFIRSYSYDVAIPNGSTELNVEFPQEVVNPPHYTVFIDICNTQDSDPSIYGYVITRKEQDYFTIRFSGIIDSPYYVLHYLVIGQIESTYVPPNIDPLGYSGVVWEHRYEDFLAEAGYGYFVNTADGSIVATLPPNPNVGDRIEISDYDGTFSLNNCTIMGNGSRIMDLPENFVCDVDGSNIVLVFSGFTHGWRIIDYTIE